jgi:Protein of unknown function (DUF3828)
LKSIVPKVLILIALFAMLPSLQAQSKATPKLNPSTLISDLYEAHNQKRGPFFQTRSRARLYKYFEKDLADLIWKDATTSKNEVGVINGDPLYDAQDMEIKNFAIANARNEEGRTVVDVTFENFGEKKKITFVIVSGTQGWRIHDIVYGENGTLRSWFRDSARSN